MTFHLLFILAFETVSMFYTSFNRPAKFWTSDFVMNNTAFEEKNKN